MFDRDNDDDGENDDDDNNVDDDGDNGENLCWFQAPQYQGLPYLLNSTFIHQYLAFNVSPSDDNFVFVYMTEIWLLPSTLLPSVTTTASTWTIVWLLEIQWTHGLSNDNGDDN